jgi:hypothetical protein
VTGVLGAGEIGDIAEGDINVMAKTGINDQIEVGVNIGSGLLVDGGSSFASALIGAKYGLGETRAVSVNFLVPAGDVDDPGLSIGIMAVHEVAGMPLNEHLQVSLLKGFAAAAANIDLFLEPVKELNEQLIFYLDVFVGTNTDNIGDTLNIDIAPNIDYVLSDKIAINAGIGINAYNGITRNEDIGIAVAVVAGL